MTKFDLGYVAPLSGYNFYGLTIYELPDDTHTEYMLLPVYLGAAIRKYHLQDGDYYISLRDNLIPMEEENMEMYEFVERINKECIYRAQQERQLHERKRRLGYRSP